MSLWGGKIRNTSGQSTCDRRRQEAKTDKSSYQATASGQTDPEYDVTSDPVQKFGNHSNRRHADRVAMRSAEVTEVSAEDIDFFFGWNLRTLSENMRLHYAGMDRLLRLSLSKVTAMM